MAYAKFEDYTTKFYGNAITEADFPRLAARAAERVDYLTRQHAASYFERDPVPIMLATCAIAEIIQQSERGSTLVAEDKRFVQTEIIGRQHTTYVAPMNTSSQEGQRAIDKAIDTAARTYLQRTGLLYRGVI